MQYTRFRCRFQRKICILSRYLTCDTNMSSDEACRILGEWKPGVGVAVFIRQPDITGRQIYAAQFTQFRERLAEI